MKAPVRLGLYGVVLLAVFAVAFATAGTVVPEETVQSWVREATDNDRPTTRDGDDSGPSKHGQHGDDTAGGASLGLAVAQDGYRLTGVSAPTEADAEGELSLTVTGPDGNPVTDFEPEHEKKLHLIAVRADGQHFAHVHPEMDDGGTWSIPWEWDAAGSYRIFADFVPAGTGERAADDGRTLSTTVQVGGDHDPAPATEPVTDTSVDGFDVSIDGDLVAGEPSTLTMTVTRDGEPVTELEPYLGAFGHLVALRDGDLAYLHVHPQEDEPQEGETSGPEIGFEATAPTEGRYLLYLDVRVDGEVHTAPLVLDTVEGASGAKGGQPDQKSGTGGEHEEGAGG